MRLRSFVVCMAVFAACSPVGGEPAAPVSEPEPVVSAPPERTPEPEPAVPTPVVVEAEPVEPTPEIAEPEPEPPQEIVTLWKPAMEPRILAVQPIVAKAAAVHGVDPHLINGVIWVESKFDRKAHNRSGARGLMQLMPKTAKSIARSLERPAKVYDADFNVHAGTWYLARLLGKFDGDERLALASYVRGPAKIRAWVEQDHPFPDGVEGFVTKVQKAQSVFAALDWPAAAPPP